MKLDTEKVLKNFVEKERKKIVEELAERFGFSLEDGMKHLNIEGINVKKEVKREKNSRIPIPFCGVKIEGCCEGIRLNHKLYTQCTNDITEELNNHKLCKTCYNQAEKSSNNEPTYGYIERRIKEGSNYRDQKGKPPVKYGNVMEKLKISRNEAEREAANQNLVIPEDEFEIKKSQRGRPKKNTIVNDSSGSEDDKSVKSDTAKKRGRPKKESKEIKSIEIEEPKDRESKEDIEENVVEPEEESDEEDEELAVVEMVINGKKYLKASDNRVFDYLSHEEIGQYNEKTKELVID